MNPVGPPFVGGGASGLGKHASAKSQYIEATANATRQNCVRLKSKMGRGTDSNADDELHSSA